jgi:hypothetical protein
MAYDVVAQQMAHVLMPSLASKQITEKLIGCGY